MKYRSNIHACLFLLALFVPLAVLAKRLPPKPVAPVTGDGVTYSTAGDGIDEFVVASDANSGKEQWRAKIYSVPIKKELETDVQTVYITKLKLSGGTLYARDESKHCYRLDLKTQKAETTACSAMKTAKSTAIAAPLGQNQN
jgi:outer membrane protein assembly factor BamB